MGIVDRLLGRKQEQLAGEGNVAEHPNVGLVRKGYEAFARGDMATLTELWSEDAVWHAGTGNNPLAGDHRGRDAVFAAFARVAELSGGTFRIELHDVLANDEHAVAMTRNTGNREGKQLDSLEVALYHVRNGRVTEAWTVSQDQRVADEFWS